MKKLTAEENGQLAAAPSMLSPSEIEELVANPRDGMFAIAAISGLTKREAFAMAAMQGLASKAGYYTSKDLASDAVNIADALLAELAR